MNRDNSINQSDLQQIALLVVGSIDRPWQQVTLYADYTHNDAPELHAVVLGQGGEKTYPDIPDLDLFRLFRSSRGVLQSLGHPLWSTARLTIEENGKFHLDLGYPD